MNHKGKNGLGNAQLDVAKLRPWHGYSTIGLGDQGGLLRLGQEGWR